MTDERIPVPERFRPLLTRVVDMVVADDVDGLRRDPQAVFVHEDDPLYWVHDYPATLVRLPEEAWAYADATPIGDGSVWYVCISLWTAEEGRSDLSLEATLLDRPGGLVVEVDGIHVL